MGIMVVSTSLDILINYTIKDTISGTGMMNFVLLEYVTVLLTVETVISIINMKWY